MPGSYSSTYVPYTPLDIRGHTIARGFSLLDFNGNFIDASALPVILAEILTELRLIRHILTETSEVSIEQEDIENGD